MSSTRHHHHRQINKDFHLFFIVNSQKSTETANICWMIKSLLFFSCHFSKRTFLQPPNHLNKHTKYQNQTKSDDSMRNAKSDGQIQNENSSKESSSSLFFFFFKVDAICYITIIVISIMTPLWYKKRMTTKKHIYDDEDDDIFNMFPLIPSFPFLTFVQIQSDVFVSFCFYSHFTYSFFHICLLIVHPSLH